MHWWVLQAPNSRKLLETSSLKASDTLASRILATLATVTASYRFALFTSISVSRFYYCLLLLVILLLFFLIVSFSFIGLSFWALSLWNVDLLNWLTLGSSTYTRLRFAFFCRTTFPYSLRNRYGWRLNLGCNVNKNYFDSIPKKIFTEKVLQFKILGKLTL